MASTCRVVVSCSPVLGIAVVLGCSFETTRRNRGRRNVSVHIGIILLSHLPQPGSSPASMSSRLAALPLPTCHVFGTAIFDLAWAERRSTLTVAFLRATSRSVPSTVEAGGISRSVAVVRFPAATVADYSSCLDLGIDEARTHLPLPAPPSPGAPRSRTRSRSEIITGSMASRCVSMLCLTARRASVNLSRLAQLTGHLLTVLCIY